MTALAWLVPVALTLGALGLAAFLWCLQSGQYDDLDGAAWRALDDEADIAPAPRDAKSLEEPAGRKWSDGRDYSQGTARSQR